MLTRLGLGTVQFGLDYGINNPGGRVSPAEVRRILEYAARHDVRFLDTARIYGTSEEALGSALAELDAFDEFTICTKLDLPDDIDSRSDQEARELTRESLYTSLETLEIDAVPYYLSHRIEYFTRAAIWEYLKEQQQAGVIGSLGASVNRGVDEAWLYLEDDAVELIQIPFNVIDGRWDESDFFRRAAAAGVTVVSRSCYLQGLLLMDPADGGARVDGAEPYLAGVRDVAAEAGIPAKELLLRFVLGRDEITSTIIGVDGMEHLRENVAIAARGPLAPEVVDALERRVKRAPEAIVNPSNWRTS